uniref:Uncharacterized protein n=1 Tax=Anguilla anguilla TaxID=7936 RepID=A0A0E9RG40_ANGAN
MTAAIFRTFRHIKFDSTKNLRNGKLIRRR